jgi:arylsulfatase A-like enzyme
MQILRLLPSQTTIADCLEQRHIAFIAPIATLTAILVALPLAAQAQSPGRPNIVFILADDMGYGDLGVTGQSTRAALGLPSFATPNIDSIAQSGVQFTNMYAGAPSCTPSRLSILTGFHQAHVISDRAENAIDIRGGDEDRTWAQSMQQIGYETGFFGKWHLGGFTGSGFIRTPGAIPNAKGFEQGIGNLGVPRQETHWVISETTGYAVAQTPPDPTWPGPGPQRQYLDNIVTDRVVDFIEAKSNSGQPFMAYVPLTGPHTPLEQVPQDHPYVNMPWGKSARDYAGMMYYLDKQVGQILRAIDDPNGDGDTSDSVAANTLVLFASDNGPNTAVADGYTPEFFDSNSIYAGTKFTTWEGGIRSPFLARWTGTIAPGTVNSEFVGSFADIMPTFADVAGFDAPLGIDGRSMLSDLIGGTPSERPDAHVWNASREIGAGSPGNFAVRVGDWKLMKNMPTSANPNVTYRLHNLAADPKELSNLSAVRPDIVSALAAIGFAEGYDREPIGPIAGTPSLNETKNTYFTQYKNWSPGNGSQDFFAPSNWSGGTKYNEYVAPDAATFPPEAQNWNTGPADNWLVQMRNDGEADQAVTIERNAWILALGLKGDAKTMSLEVAPGVQLRAQNGFRIEGNGLLRLNGGELNTVRELDIREGGVLEGYGRATGQQQLVASIPEFANLGLFTPHVVNAGDVRITGSFPSHGAAGELVIDGDYTQLSGGTLKLDLYASNGNGGVDFDKLSITGTAKLSGALSLTLAQTTSLNPGDQFEILTADRGLSGVFNSVHVPTLSDGLGWSLSYSTSSVLLKVVSISANYLALWNSSFGLNSEGDITGDGFTDGADFLAWQRQVASVAAPLVTVPEPSTGLMFGVALVAVSRFARRPLSGNVSKRPRNCL